MIEYRSVEHGSPEFLATVALRQEVLCRPLGIELTPADLAAESDSFHLSLWKDGELLGCLVLHPITPGRFKIRQVAVQPAFQGRGYGVLLMRYAEKVAGEKGADEIYLNARDTARTFYEKLGFRYNGEPFMEAGIAHYPMEKSLA